MGEDDATNTDAVSAPLIANDANVASHHNQDDWRPSDAESTLETEDYSEEQALERPNLFIWGLTFSAGLSGLLFGYEYVGLSSRHLRYSHVYPILIATVRFIRIRQRSNKSAAQASYPPPSSSSHSPTGPSAPLTNPS